MKAIILTIVSICIKKIDCSQFNSFVPNVKLHKLTHSTTKCSSFSQFEIFVPAGFQQLLQVQIQITNACFIDNILMEISTDDWASRLNYVTTQPEFLNSDDSACSELGRYNSAVYSFGVFAVDDNALISIKVRM